MDGDLRQKGGKVIGCEDLKELRAQHIVWVIHTIVDVTRSNERSRHEKNTMSHYPRHVQIHEESA